MIAELIMHVMNWTDVWYAHPGPIKTFGLGVFSRCRWIVGTWTGAEYDLLSVKACPRRDGMTDKEVNAEAEKWLSPGANSILAAALKSLLKRWRLGRKLNKCPHCGVLPGEGHLLECIPAWAWTVEEQSGKERRTVWTGNTSEPSVGYLPPTIVRPGGLS